jgi:hypothetical protein
MAQIRASGMAAATAWSSTPAGEPRGSPPEPYARTFKLADRVLRVRTRDPWVAELLESTYARLRCAADRADQCVDLSPGGDFVRAFYAVRDCFTAFACLAANCIPLYGACIAVCGRAVLLLGPSTIGKTVCAFNMQTAGARFLGDELALLNLADGTISAVPRMPSLREPGLPFLVDRRLRLRIANCKRALRTTGGRLWYALDASTLWFEADARPSPLAAVYVVSSRAGAASAHPMHFAPGFASIVRRMHRAPELAELGALRRITCEIPFFDLTIGDPQETVALLLRSFRACA